MVPDKGFPRGLARIAHSLWCTRLLAQGWTPGPRYDEEGRTHDALVPFEQLDPRDLRWLEAGLATEGIEALLIRAADYPRGAARELGLSEMRPGLAVTDDRGESRGVIESWTTDASGRLLEVIRVRWGDGTTTEHAPVERELRLFPSPPTPPRPDA